VTETAELAQDPKSAGEPGFFLDGPEFIAASSLEINPTFSLSLTC
jgi:hypothetical protein